MWDHDAGVCRRIGLPVVEARDPLDGILPADLFDLDEQLPAIGQTQDDLHLDIHARQST